MNFNPDKSQNTPVNLDRNIPFESGIQYNPEYYYRMIGQEGYEDFLEFGAIRARQSTKQSYDNAYFFKGAPLSRYAETKSEIQYFIEVNPDGNELFEVSAEGQYPHPKEDISSNNKIKIYKVDVTGSHVVFDNM